MNKSLVLIGLQLLAFVGVSLGASTYYVSPTGDDSAGNGSTTKPWRTVNYAGSRVMPGDTVIVNPGTYEETVSLPVSGTAANRIRFVGGGKAKTGSITLLGSHITIDGFDIAGPLPSWSSAIRIMPQCQGIWLHNNNIHDMTSVYGVGMSSNGTLPEEGPQSCIISNNIFNHIGYINVNLYGSNHLVTANTFANSYGEGDAVRLWGAKHRVISNVMTNVGGGDNPGLVNGGHPDLFQTFGDFGVGSADMLIERNLAIDCKSQFCQIEQKGVEEIRDWTIRNNLFIRVDAAANCNIPGIWWLNNLFYRCTTNTGHVIVFSDGSSGRGFAWRSGAKNNVFLECGSNPNNNTFGWYTRPDVLTDLDCNYNYVAGPNFAPKRNDAGLQMWRFIERNGINGGDPGFVSISRLDFRPVSTSALRDTAATLIGFASDYTGAPRPSGPAWDIGAYEFRDGTFISSPRNLRVLSP